MSSQTINLLHIFDGHNFTEWNTTARHVINATGCCIALNSKPLPVLVNSVETDESIRVQDNWDDQDTKTYSNLMLRISPDIRNLAVKTKIQDTKKLLDWLKTQYSTTSISAAYTDAIAVNKLFVLGDCNPTSTIDRLLALFTCFENNKFIIPKLVQAMTLLSNGRHCV